ncbi:hypothetical protein KUCAC02_019615, partial [Chaenocephalus aceratus]
NTRIKQLVQYHLCEEVYLNHLCGPWKTIKRGGLLPGARHSSDSSGLMSELRGGIWTRCCLQGPRQGWDIPTPLYEGILALAYIISVEINAQ